MKTEIPTKLKPKVIHSVLGADMIVSQTNVATFKKDGRRLSNHGIELKQFAFVSLHDNIDFRGNRLSNIEIHAPFSLRIWVVI